MRVRFDIGCAGRDPSAGAGGVADLLEQDRLLARDGVVAGRLGEHHHVLGIPPLKVEHVRDGVDGLELPDMFRPKPDQVDVRMPDERGGHGVVVGGERVEETAGLDPHRRRAVPVEHVDRAIQPIDQLAPARRKQLHRLAISIPAWPVRLVSIHPPMLEDRQFQQHIQIAERLPFVLVAHAEDGRIQPAALVGNPLRLAGHPDAGAAANACDMHHPTGIAQRLRQQYPEMSGIKPRVRRPIHIERRFTLIAPVQVTGLSRLG